MQVKPMHRSSSRFLVLDLAIHAIETLRPVVEAVQRRDRDLADQLRRALSSVAVLPILEETLREKKKQAR
jgi:hypothetical protein